VVRKAVKDEAEKLMQLFRHDAYEKAREATQKARRGQNARLESMASPKKSTLDVRVKRLRRYRNKSFYSVVGGDTVEIIHIRPVSNGS
jgi:hypothetical protein